MLHLVRSLALLLFPAGLLLAGAIGPPAAPPAQQSPVAPLPPAAVPQQSLPPLQERPGLNIVVLDPAHGGADSGARGAGGIRESDLVLVLAGQIRAALEKQGFSVLQTRRGNDDPSLDDRAALANAQRGAMFISLHVGSTGLPGTARVYTLPALPGTPPPAGALLPWDRAQLALLPMSRKLAELAQVQLSLRFKGSPTNAPAAFVRQLNSVALPAIALELSNVSVQDPAVLERMFPGVAESIAEAVRSYKQAYDADLAHGAPSAQPPGSSR